MRFLLVPCPPGMLRSCQDRMAIKLNFTLEAAPTGIPPHRLADTVQEDLLFRQRHSLSFQIMPTFFYLASCHECLPKGKHDVQS